VFHPAKVYLPSNSVYYLAPGCYLQDELHDVSENGLAASPSGYPSFDSFEPQFFEGYPHSQPYFLATSNLSNQAQGFVHPSDTPLVDSLVDDCSQGSLSSFVEQSLALSKIESQSIINCFDTGSINYRPPCQLSNFALQNSTKSSNNTKDTRVSATKTRHFCNWNGYSRSFSRAADRDRPQDKPWQRQTL
jgi:hypothetical protein